MCVGQPSELGGTLNQYEWKLERKRQRLENAAARAKSEGDSSLKYAVEMLRCIPPGQPILVGHHSEKRHRSHLARSDSKMRSGFARLKDAEDYARRAAAVGTSGISSDDPDAVDKLTDKVADLEAKRDRMKLVNALYRKKDAAGLEKLGLSLEALTAQIEKLHRWDRQPYPSYSLSNLGARIRDAKKRASRLERHNATAVDATIELEAATVKADAGDNRVTICFHNYLTKESYKTMRSAGFVWSPTRDGFTRKLSSYSVESAKALAETIIAKEKK